MNYDQWILPKDPTFNQFEVEEAKRLVYRAAEDIVDDYYDALGTDEEMSIDEVNELIFDECWGFEGMGAPDYYIDTVVSDFTVDKD